MGNYLDCLSNEDKTGKVLTKERAEHQDDDPTNPTYRKADDYARRLRIERSRVINSEVEGDQEIFEFAQKHKERVDLQGIVVNSDRVRSIDRVDQDEASENGVRALNQLVANNLELVVFHFNGQRMDAWRAPALVEALRGHPSLQIVDLYDCKVDDDGAEFLVANLKDNPSVKEINLGGNDDVDAETRTKCQDMTAGDNYNHLKLRF